MKADQMTLYEDQVSREVAAGYKEWMKEFKIDLPDEAAIKAYRSAQSILINALIKVFTL